VNKKKYALVIDDEEPVREYVKYCLEKADYNVILCDNGKDGLERFYARRYDVVITDIVMPEKDGIEAIIEMRRMFPPVPILAISGVDSRETLFKIANMFHADATLKKPFTHEELLDSVSKAIIANEEASAVKVRY
jgi:DNA-binding response OmpR family regulator